MGIWISPAPRGGWCVAKGMLLVTEFVYWKDNWFYVICVDSCLSKYLRGGSRYSPSFHTCSLTIYPVHNELIIDKHLQSNLKQTHFYLRELISSTLQNYFLHQAYWTWERRLMLIINLYAGRGGRFFSISKQAGRTVECRMIDECAGRRRLDERMYAVPGETPMGRIFSVGRQSNFLVSPGESKSITTLLHQNADHFYSVRITS